MRDLCELAIEIGFSHAAALDPQKLRVLPEVRAMCAANRCHRYGHSWSCPPACGSLEETEKEIRGFDGGILVQTTAALEDEFDADGISASGKKHKNSFMILVRQTRLLLPDCLPLGAGACTVCLGCTYPEKACRFPARRISSMEAYGLLVSEVCGQAGLKYYYGPKTLTWSSCILYKGEDSRDTERDIS